MNLVDVGGVDGGGKETEGEVVAVSGRDGVGMEGEDFAGIAVFGEGEGFCLFVAVGGNEAALGGCEVESAERSG